MTTDAWAFWTSQSTIGCDHLGMYMDEAFVGLSASLFSSRVALQLGVCLLVSVGNSIEVEIV